MRLILLGPPGCGKGTLSAGLVDHYTIPHISTGDMFREHLHNQDELGKLAASYMDKGNLVPDSVVIDMVSERLGKADCNSGFLFDGFPRTVAQGEALEKRLSELGQALTAVVLLEVEDEVLVKRLAERRVCPKCGAVYHLTNKPAKKAGICDECATELIHREDDHEDVIRERLNVYRQQTEPLVSFYSERGLLLRVDGTQKPKEVEAQVLELLKKL